MEFTIEHKTSYRYAAPVDQSYTVVHLQPRSDTNQFCTRYALDISPTARINRYTDRFGNDVQHFAILPSHADLAITARSNVVTLLSTDPVDPVEATRALLDADPRLAEAYDFLHESVYVGFGPRLDRFLDEVGRPGERIGEWVHCVSSLIHEQFEYDKAATTVRTTVEDALERRSGVCQDFAHVMIATLRRAHVPARYVSGYIFGGESRVLGAEASHAWCEAYLPPYGWVGFDPTNDRLIDDSFVRIATGRDYRDVSPVRGVYRGAQLAEMNVNVAMDLLTPQREES